MVESLPTPCVRQGVHVPVKLGKDLQPEAALRVLSDKASKDKAGHDLMAPNQEVWLPIWLRTTREGRTKVRMLLQRSKACFRFMT